MDGSFSMILSLVLGLVSFVMISAGTKAQRLDWALWGIAVGCPSYAPTEPFFWGLGVIAGYLAWRVQIS